MQKEIEIITDDPTNIISHNDCDDFEDTKSGKH